MTKTKYHFIRTNKANKAAREMFCINHSGKMSGMISISSSPLENPRCKYRAECGGDGCICRECYSNSMMKQYSNLAAKLARNTAVLIGGIIPSDELPEINPERHELARVEAFGDLINEVQAINYISIIATNRGVKFGWWTKNPDIIADAIASGYEIPDNAVIIYSNPRINTTIDIEALREVYPFINKVFNVWTDEAAAREAGVDINCGARHCATCRRCYNKETGEYINELLK